MYKLSLPSKFLYFFCTLICIVALSIISTGQAHAAELIIKFKTPKTKTAKAKNTYYKNNIRRAVLQVKGAKYKTDLSRLNAAVITVPDKYAKSAEQKIRRQANVAQVQRDKKLRKYGEPSARFWDVPDLTDPYMGGGGYSNSSLDVLRPSQWGLDAIGSDNAMEYSRGKNVKVAVLDSGVDLAHPDLRPNLIQGYDFVDGDKTPYDGEGHGTHVAGIIGAVAGNGIGIAGVAPEAKIMPVRVLNNKGEGSYATVARGIIWAADRGAKVINLSLGGEDNITILREAVDYAAAMGAIVTCATGNEGRKDIGFPAKYSSCLSVGAINALGQKAKFSNYGAGINLVAPGVSIISTVPGNKYASWDGTSMASPYVSGVAALLKSQGLSRKAIFSILHSSSKDLGAKGRDLLYGRGSVDAFSAVQSASRQPRAAADKRAPVIRKVFYNRTVKYNKKTKRKVTRWRVRANIGDNQGVDRAAIIIGGRLMQVDWSPAGGWVFDVPCYGGVRAVRIVAWDRSDNRRFITQRRYLRC